MRCLARIMPLALLVLLAIQVQARAQYSNDYGPPWYPYAAWQGGSTAPGDIIRSEAMYLQALGDYELRCALAAMVHSERLAMENEYLSACRQSIMWQASQRRRFETARLNAVLAEMRRRKLEYPMIDDVNDGSSLNLLLRELSACNTPLEQLPASRAQMKSDMVRSLPLLCSGATRPVSLRQADRTDAPREFRDQVIKANEFSYDAFRMDLDDDGQVAISDLVMFLTSFNLRLGKATSADEREAYETLHRRLWSMRMDLVQAPGDRVRKPEVPRAAR